VHQLGSGSSTDDLVVVFDSFSNTTVVVFIPFRTMPATCIFVFISQNLYLQNVNRELEKKLQEISDLKVVSEQLAEHETPESSKRLRGSLTDLQDRTIQFKKEMAQKEETIKELIRVGEKNRLEVEQCRQNTDDLKKWFEETRKPIPEVDLRTSSDEQFNPVSRL